MTRERSIHAAVLFAWLAAVCLRAEPIQEPAAAPPAVKPTVAETRAEPRLAVLGFADRRAAAAQDPTRTAGLADLLAFSLSEEGVAVIDRRSIGGSLSERRLRRLIGDEPDAERTAALPAAGLFVRGELADRTGLGLLVTLEARRGDDGSLVQRVSFPADTNDQLAGAVTLAARRLVPSLRNGADDRPHPAHLARPARRIAGFTENPEAALLFYRGLEQLAEGRATLAIACLDQAIRLDREFVTARVWLYHALNRAGLPDFAQASIDWHKPHLRDELRQRITTVGSLIDTDKLVLATIVEPTAVEQAQRLEGHWAADPRLRVLSTDGLSDARDEQDLKLSGEFQHLPAVIDRWLFSDVLVRVSADSVRLFDMKSGQQLGEAPLATAAEPGWVLTTAKPSDRDRRRPLAAASPVTARGPATVDAEGVNLYEVATPRHEPTGVMGASADRVLRTAHLLDRALREPENVSAWWAVARLWRFWSCRPALDRMVVLIDGNRSLPNAAAWLSAVGHSRFEWDFHNPWRPPLLAAETEPTVAERYPELLAWFPDSLPAQAVKITLAFEHAALGREAQAIESLRSIAPRLPSYDWPGSNTTVRSINANVYFELARLLTRAGAFQEARRWHRRCLQEDLSRRLWDLSRIMLLVQHSRVRFYMNSANGVSHLDVLKRRRKDFDDLRPQIRELGLYLDAVERGHSPGPFRGFVDAYVESFNEPNPRRRFALQAESVERWLRQHTAGGQTDRLVPARVLQQLAWLRIYASDEQEHRRVEALLNLLLDRMPIEPPRYASSTQTFETDTLLLLAGREDQVQARIGADLARLHVRHALGPLYRQIALDSLRFEPGEATARIEALLDKHHAALASGSVEKYFGYHNLIEQVAPVLMERGRFARVAELYEHVLDDPRVPWVYKGRATAEHAVAQARLGQPEAAAAALSVVLEQAVTRSAEREGPLVVRPSGREGYAYRNRWPDDPAGLAYRVNDHLRRLRLFEGRATTTPFDLSTVRFSPLGDDTRTRGRLHALAYLLSQKSSYHDYMGTSFWPHEAARSLFAMGPDAKPWVERLLWAVTLQNANQLEPKRQASWFALSVASRMGPQHGLARRWLLDRLSWSPICEIKMHAARALMTAGYDDPQTVSTLAMASAMFGGCELNARYALRQLGRLEPTSAEALTRLLDHPVEDARRYAASALQRHHGMDLPQHDGLPTDQAVAHLKQWLERASQTDTPEPAGDVHLGLTTAAFDHAGHRWIAGGSGATVWTATVDHPDAAIPLDHAPAAWVSEVKLSGDGSTAATYAQDHRIRVWRISQPDSPLLVLPARTKPFHLALDATGSRLAYDQGGGRVVVVDTATGQTLRHVETYQEWVSNVEFLDRPNHVISTTGQDVALTTFDLETGRRVRHGFGTGFGFDLIQRMPGGRLLTCGDDHTVRVWTPGPTWTSVRLDGPFDNPFAAAPSPNGDRIVTQDAHGRLGVWDSHTGKRLATFQKNEPKVYGVAWPAGSGPVLILHDGSLIRFSQDLDPVQTIRLLLFEKPQTQEVHDDDC
ncbi:MAG: hypothetical protein AAF750_08835 [Planctomycetota bacterium]